MLWIIIGIIVSYLIGSIPTAYIFGRLLKGIDIRKQGSGNVGATNALRVLGKKAGISVLIIDILKGFITVVLVGNIIAAKTDFLSSENLRILLGLACVFGHNWTVFLNFKGGKGMAATLGILLGLTTQITGLKNILAITILIWLAVVFICRIISIASVASAVVLPILMVIFKQSNTLIILSLILSVFVILRHKANLKRIIEGKEPKITFKKPQ
ncbi:MAG: glycerol-3-phosphate 1-O-acyltransferase PlsY [Candidatus Omnitrophota bacterium]